MEDRLKYNVVPSALGVGNASNASVLSRGPRFVAGPHGWLFDARVATYMSALPKPPLRFDAKYSALPSFESRSEKSPAIGSSIGAPWAPSPYGMGVTASGGPVPVPRALHSWNEEGDRPNRAGHWLLH